MTWAKIKSGLLSQLGPQASFSSIMLHSSVLPCAPNMAGNPEDSVLIWDHNVLYHLFRCHRSKLPCLSWHSQLLSLFLPLPPKVCQQHRSQCHPYRTPQKLHTGPMQSALSPLSLPHISFGHSRSHSPPSFQPRWPHGCLLVEEMNSHSALPGHTRPHSHRVFPLSL